MQFLLSLESLAQALCVSFSHLSRISQQVLHTTGGAIKYFCMLLSWPLELALEMGTCVQEKESFSSYQCLKWKANTSTVLLPLPLMSLMDIEETQLSSEGLGEEIALSATIFRRPIIILSSLWFPIGWSHNSDTQRKCQQKQILCSPLLCLVGVC